MNVPRRLFYVVQFIQLPFARIDNYVCVPDSWVILRRSTDRKVLVAYPKDEDPFDTRDRAERKEKYGDDWQFYLAIIKYESDTYRDAVFWIATRNDYGPFAEENSKIKDTQPESTLDKKLRSALLNHLSRSQKSENQLTVTTNDNPLKPMMKISSKRLNQSDPEEQLDKKRLKLDEAAKSTSGVVNYATVEPGCSKRKQSIIIRDDQSTESIQAEERAAAFNSKTSTERSIQSQSTKKNVSFAITDNIPSTSHHLPNSLKLSAQLQRYMSDKPSLLPIHNQVNKKIQQSSPAQELERSTESNFADYKADSRTIRKRISSEGRNSTNVSKQFYQKIDPPQQRQLQPNHQNLPRDPRGPRIHVGISSRSQNNNQTLGFYGPTKRMPPSVHPEFSNSIRHAFVTGHGIEKVVDSACQTDGSINNEPLSPSYEAVSDHDMSTNETLIEITNDVDSIQIPSESNSADRPTAPKRPTTTILQKHPRIILEQQMLNTFPTLLTQMGSTLAYTRNMFDNLRSSIHESVATYKRLSDAVEKFNTLGNSATTPSSSSNVLSDVQSKT